MNTNKHLSSFFALLGAILLLSAVVLSLLALNAPARLLFGTTEADARTQALMDALCEKNYAAASALMLGNPQLDADSTPDSSLGALLWEAYADSLSYEFSGSCYAGESGVCRDVTITALDIPALMVSLKDQAQTLLRKGAASANPEEIYNEDGSYQDAFLTDALKDGAAALLSQRIPTASRTITLHLTARDGQWYILPEQALLDVIAGGMRK